MWVIPLFEANVAQYQGREASRDDRLEALEANMDNLERETESMRKLKRECEQGQETLTILLKVRIEL